MGPIPADFPKGFNAFYCMKYEVSQEQYVAFFNTLTDAQKIARDPTDADNKNSDDEFIGNSISWESGNAITNTGARPINYVNWGDVNAYLDWAGLRLMSELEYVKACRGTLPAVADEFAWGNSNIHSVNYTIVSDGTTNENISNPAQGIGNAAYQGAATSKPLRCGIFASSAINKNREETGGSYYGIMELTGNVYERAITVGNSTGRAFNGLHGDGTLTANYGDGFHLYVEWMPDGTMRSECIHQWGAARWDDQSPHYDDQVELFAEMQLKETWITEEQIEANLKRAYAPGEAAFPWYGGSP